MNSRLKVALVLAAAVAAGIGCNPAAVAPSVVAPSAAATSQPAASPSLQAATAAATPSPNALDTSLWTTYTSNRYGFSIAHPAEWHEDPAEHDWTFDNDAIWPNSATEHFELPVPDAGVGVSVWSVAVDPGTSVESWLQAYCHKNGVGCTGSPDWIAIATKDGHPGSLLIVDDVPHALFLVDKRMYVIACWRPDDDPSVLRYSGSKQLVQAYASTMRLLPAGPATSPATPGPS